MKIAEGGHDAVRVPPMWLRECVVGCTSSWLMPACLLLLLWQFQARFMSALLGDDSSSDEDEDDIIAAERRELLDRIAGRLPVGWEGREVTGNHRKACTFCGHSDWMEGEMYFTDFLQPYGAEKLCENCIEMWLDEHAEFDGEG